MLTTLTSKGQLTVPKAIRDRLNLHPGDKIEFILDNKNNCQIIPLRSSIKEMKGMLGPASKIVSIEEMDTVIQKEAASHDRH
ncbi:AbrB/MazE/SpoVT family DNA-binding domain-containing protein [bacterium]|nr:AbrB/MazE/SpoVT family DNA-binding domain-containing protein [bacterium]